MRLTALPSLKVNSFSLVLYPSFLTLLVFEVINFINGFKKLAKVPPPKIEKIRVSQLLNQAVLLFRDEAQKKKIEKDVTKKAPKFNNYIQVYLSDKTLEELSGSFGRNRVSRELRDYFNEVLFEDGIERVQDVLFNDFQVQ